MNARIDFLSARPKPTVMGWLLLALGVCSLALSILVLQSSLQHQQDMRLARQQQQEAAEQARIAKQRSSNPSPEDGRLQAALVVLNKPWTGTLRAIEAATQGEGEPVYLLSLNIEPSANLIRLEGETESFQGIVAFMAALERSGALSTASLHRHERIQGPLGTPSLRFSLDARGNSP